LEVLVGAKGGLFRLDPSTAKPTKVPNANIGEIFSVHSLPDPLGGALVSAERGLFRYSAPTDKTNGGLFQYNAPTDKTHKVLDNAKIGQIFSIQGLPRGEGLKAVLVGAQGGLFRLDPSTAQLTRMSDEKTGPVYGEVQTWVTRKDELALPCRLMAR
jgi:hypothetical protein